MASGSDEPLVRRDDLAAALEAHHELGPEYEPEVVDALAERIERRVEARMNERLTEHRRGANPVLAFASLGIAIPLLGIAGGTAGLPGVVAVCAALVLVNLIYARR